MPSAFAQSMRSLAADRGRRSAIAIACAAAVLGAWTVWFVRADVTEYEVSESARVEVERAAHPIDAPTSGRIAVTRLVLGAEVHAGDVVVEIDSESERRRLAEEKTRLAMITPELEAVRRVLAAQEQSMASDRVATLTALDEARAREHEADISAKLAAELAQRSERLGDGGAIAEVEVLRAKTEADRRRAETDALALDVLRQKGDQATRESKLRATMEDLRRDETALETRRATTIASIATLEHEIELRFVRSPVDGRIGDVSTIEPGSYVKEGDKLASVVPPGELKVIGSFVPSSAIGRIKPGQPARVRLDSFPWTQYGTVAATVSQVGSEPRDGRIRVELLVVRDPPPRIPLEHGLPGVVEVAVEHVTPATMVLRAVGRFLARPGEG